MKMLRFKPLAHVDRFAINASTVHQYYNTVQCDEHGDRLVDHAMERRHALAMASRRRSSGRPAWMSVLALGLVLACGVWLLS